MEKQLAQYGVYFLQNPQPEKEDASIDMGLRYLSGKCEWIYLMDADRPLLDPDSLVDLLPIHPLQSDFPICTTSVLLLIETTFLPPT
jgi:hypothetical protein